MKNYAVLIAFVLLPFWSWAQSNENNTWLDQGQVQIGVGVGVGRGGNTGGYIRASPYAQYFIKNGLALRLEGRYNYNGPDGDKYAGAGLLGQYHVVRTNRFSAYAQAGYFYGNANYSLYRSNPLDVSAQPILYREQVSYGMFNLGLGAQYRMGNRWSVNALIERNIGQRIGSRGADKDNLTLGIGFRIK